MRRYFTGDQRRKRVGRQRNLLERSVAEIGGENARQRQQRRKQRRDPEHARTERAQQRRLGPDAEREERHDNDVEKKLDSDLGLGAQRKAQVACERPSHALPRARRRRARCHGVEWRHESRSIRLRAPWIARSWCVAITAMPPGDRCEAIRRSSCATPAASIADAGSSSTHNGRRMRLSRARATSSCRSGSHGTRRKIAALGGQAALTIERPCA